MSNLGYRSRSRVQPSKAVFRNPLELGKIAIPGSIYLTDTVLADGDSVDLYAPNDFIPPGTLLALATGGAYDTYWVPFLPNISSANGEDTAAAMLLEPVYLTRDQSGAVEDSIVVASILVEGSGNVQVFVSKVPEYNDHTAYAGGSGSSAAAVAADLPTGFVDLESYGVDNLAGL